MNRISRTQLAMWATMGVAMPAAMGPPNALAAPIASYQVSDVNLDALSRTIEVSSVTEEAVTGSDKLTTFMTSRGEPFPTRAVPDLPFTSGEIRADFTHQVGASGTLFMAGALSSQVKASFTWTNTGNVPLGVTYGYTIPDSEALLHTMPGVANQVAFIRTWAQLTETFDTPDGPQTTAPFFLYDYSLEVEKTTNGFLSQTLSNDLKDVIVADQTQLIAVDEPAPGTYGKIVGARFPGFDAVEDIGDFSPGDSWLFEIFGVARIASPAEYGGQAQIGDPINFVPQAPYSFTFTEVTAPGPGPEPGPGGTVAEPSSWSLALAGLGIVGLLARRRARRQEGC